MEASYHAIESAVAGGFPLDTYGLIVTADTGGKHAPHSLHYVGLAVDYGTGHGGGQAAKDALAQWLYQFSQYFLELIHTNASSTGGWYVKNGVRKPKGFYGGVTEAAHINHVHVAATLDAVGAWVTTPLYLMSWNQTQLGTDGVKLLQNRLMTRYLSTAVRTHGGADGHFGPTTLAVVKAVQSKMGFHPDGRVTPALRKIMGF